MKITIFCQSIFPIVLFAARKELVAHGTVPREWIDSSASLHSIIGDGKGKSYVLAKKEEG